MAGSAFARSVNGVLSALLLTNEASVVQRRHLLVRPGLIALARSGFWEGIAFAMAGWNRHRLTAWRLCDISSRNRRPFCRLSERDLAGAVSSAIERLDSSNDKVYNLEGE